jgi:hypothetical protein
VVLEPRGRRQHQRGAGHWCGASGHRGPRWHSSSSGDEGVTAVALKRSWHGGGDGGEGSRHGSGGGDDGDSTAATTTGSQRR